MTNKPTTVAPASVGPHVYSPDPIGGKPDKTGRPSRYSCGYPGCGQFRGSRLHVPATEVPTSPVDAHPFSR